MTGKSWLHAPKLRPHSTPSTAAAARRGTHPRQLAYKQRAEKAAQQVERRDRQRLVVVHILHPGDKQHRQDCTDRRQYREGARLFLYSPYSMPISIMPNTSQPR